MPTPPRPAPSTAGLRARLERGEISEMVIVLVLSMFLVVGLVVDGGAKMTASSHAVGLAQGAARAGAQQIGSLPTAGKPAQIDPARAQAAAEQFIASTHEGTGTVTVENGTTLRVTVTVHEPTTFLGLIGIHDLTSTRTVEVSLLDGPDDTDAATGGSPS